MSRRDLTGAVDFHYLESYAAHDAAVVDEVLGLFREQAALWSPMLEPTCPSAGDAVHTVKGAARGVGAGELAVACEHYEDGEGCLGKVRTALDAALADIAAYQHERMLQSLRG